MDVNQQLGIYPTLEHLLPWDILRTGIPPPAWTHPFSLHDRNNGMQTRTPRALVAAAVLALFASACADVPTAALAGRAPGRTPSLATFSSGVTLIPNTVKYRDTGGRPATGRSGSAVVDALALLDREGATTLSIAARHATEPWRSGTIDKLQVKAYAPDGQHKFTQNLHPTAAPDTFVGVLSTGDLRIQGLGRGDQMRLQANVTGLDGRRTDVVTVVESVKRLPDLTVQLAGPAEAGTNLPVNFFATVSEVNGDVGTHAACELYGGGQLLDQAYGIWVDAGDEVTCAFTTIFSIPGAHALEVRVTTSGGREWDGGNNTDTATIQVHGEGASFRTNAFFVESVFERDWLMEEQWWDLTTGEAGERTVEEHSNDRQQIAMFGGHMPQRMAGPVDLRASMSTGGQVVELLERQISTPSMDAWCVFEWEGAESFQLCSGGDGGPGFTEFRYSMMRGELTYHGHEYSRVWDQLTGEELYVYHRNYTYGPSGSAVPLGADWTFDVRLSTPGGEHALHAALYPVPSGPSEWTSRFCNSWDGWDYSSKTCHTQTDRNTFLSAGGWF
jgi:hypothetical protein